MKMAEKNIDLYRPCVGICLINDKKEVFVAHRYRVGDPTNETIAFVEYMQKEKGKNKGNQLENSSVFKDSLWQMPQGGIDSGEDIEQAARRELYEETGIKRASILKMSKTWYFYELPKEVTKKSWKEKYIGQRQKWVLMHFSGEESEINLDVHHHKEFDQWKWVDPQILPYIVVSFKKAVYKAVLKEFF